MPLGGRVQCIDFCIHHIVAALNAGGIRTVASCCGHEEMPGRIDLEDGRTLAIANNRDAQGGQAGTFWGFTDLVLAERLRGDPTLLAVLDRWTATNWVSMCERLTKVDTPRGAK